MHDKKRFVIYKHRNMELYNWKLVINNGILDDSIIWIDSADTVEEAVNKTNALNNSKK